MFSATGSISCHVANIQEKRSLTEDTKQETEDIESDAIVT